MNGGLFNNQGICEHIFIAKNLIDELSDAIKVDDNVTVQHTKTNDRSKKSYFHSSYMHFISIWGSLNWKIIFKVMIYESTL